jgi:hypothetical protein
MTLDSRIIDLKRTLVQKGHPHAHYPPGDPDPVAIGSMTVVAVQYRLGLLPQWGTGTRLVIIDTDLKIA